MPPPCPSRHRTAMGPSPHLRRCGMDAPAAPERLARLEAQESLARPERVRRARHRLDCEAAPVDSRQVAREELDERERVVEPEDGVADADAGEAVEVAFELGERRVDPARADALRLVER